MQVLYTAEVLAEGARTGHVRSSDGVLDLKLASPREMGGGGGATNPEQLFGAGYAACFGGAVEYLARQQKLSTGTIAVKARVDIGPHDPGKGEGFVLRVALEITVPEQNQAGAEKLVREADKVCPYSNAVRGNIEVALTARGGQQG